MEDYYDAYEKALAFENKSAALYESQLSAIEISVATDGRRTVLKNIIHQERAHALFITCLMEFNRSPGEWLENAEWYQPRRILAFRNELNRKPPQHAAGSTSQRRLKLPFHLPVAVESAVFNNLDGGPFCFQMEATAGKNAGRQHNSRTYLSST